jgi:hypothetical protein
MPRDTLSTPCGLEVTALEPIDIAFLLGFAASNSLLCAFRSWERTTPLRWRAARR